MTTSRDPGPEPANVTQARQLNYQALDYARQQRWDEAAYYFQQALAACPDYFEGRVNLGSVLYHQGHYEQAAEQYRRAIQLNPQHGDVYSNLGTALACLGRHEEAAVICRQAIALAPRNPHGHNNLGTALHGLKKYEEAIAAYDQAVALQPGFPEALKNAGQALLELNRAPEAATRFQQALDVRPDYPEALHGLGNALSLQDRNDEALAQYRRALQVRPNYAEAYYGMAVTLSNMARPREAIEQYTQALNLRPDYGEASYGRGLAWLLLGNFERGWPAYEARFRCQMFKPRLLPQPCWIGGDLAGKTILVFAEQGLGDTLMFVRYAPLVKQRGGTVILECQPPLASLFARCSGVDQVVPQGSALPPFDVQVPLPSLPGIFKTDLHNIPAPQPYLSAEPARVEAWRERFRALDGFKVGIAWQGNRDNPNDVRRSMPLRAFAPLANIPGVRLISFQKGPGEEQLQDAGPFVARAVGEALTDFEETAAALANLDLVITADTSIAHMAGALGVPTWVVLPFAPDWRWLLEREDSPWYPSLRLFRQGQSGDWAEVFARVHAELERRCLREGARSASEG